jgi:hypothetical protein
MFEDLYDSIRMLFSWSWPTEQAEITVVEIERIRHARDPDELRLSVCYKFYVGDDGPYSGEGFWKPVFSLGQVKRLHKAVQTMKQNHTVPVHYRPDDPSQNRLGRETWRGL